MVTQLNPSAKPEIIYPESDGKPMADNTEQFRWIVTIQGGIDAWFKDDPNVFVAGDLLWYPVEGQGNLKIAPDIMVALGRPKGKRSSYLQWKEDNIPPQVVFEILSPGNTIGEMAKKFEFYQDYGVEEYYIYDPDKIDFGGWVRQDNKLTAIAEINGWVSPRLGIRFEMGDDGLEIYRPDGRKFATYIELETERNLAEQRAQMAEQRAQMEAQRAEIEAQRAEAEAQRAEAEAQRAEAEAQRAQRLAEKLRELGIDPDAV
ncbi:Uma2 family endonuclease [[Phormidium] sp. ETS-05]|uniref:Uma2 family endonuclease n=1 Tax=[Phormidium] sp. ETS-05 TaxID=222819 RepID=UPI0018EEE589|nr:Uma2 family endonuclease [[Phormidium] sp. ETS-05]